MKLLASAIFSLLVLVSGQSVAEQSHPTTQHERDAVRPPSAQNTSPFDFNHMSSGNDKSDKLGVPYYN